MHMYIKRILCNIYLSVYNVLKKIFWQCKTEPCALLNFVGIFKV